ncbi:MAG: MtrB/PioB family outer membrane beta-barrel protein, partial [Pseudomonadota bacterium]
IPDRLDVGADAVISRARSQLRVDTGIGDPAFPVDRMATDTIKVYASYKLSDSVSLNAGLWSERGLARDWRLAGVGPATLPNLLAFGLQPADYRVYVLRASVRYRF